MSAYNSEGENRSKMNHQQQVTNEKGKIVTHNDWLRVWKPGK